MGSQKKTKRPSPIEKRMKNRRVIVDRREEVRFEPLAENRPQN
ncbi:MAG: hypothetical protein P8N61_00895 [Porticoccaceae bacterium]|nr:hypothetical protein [Porticoccaceae bacterium]